MSQLKPAWDRGIPCPLDKPHCGPGAGLSQPTATLENLQPNIFSHLAQAPEGLFLCLKMKKKKKSANIPNGISEAGLQTVKSWILWRKLLCLFVFTFYCEIFQNYLVWIARYWSLSFSSSEFMDYLTSTLPSLTSPTPSPGLFQSKSHMWYHLISKFNGVFLTLVSEVKQAMTKQVDSVSS